MLDPMEFCWRSYRNKRREKNEVQVCSASTKSTETTNMKSNDSFIPEIFNRSLSSCDCFAIDFPIGPNTHFIAKQLQYKRSLTDSFTKPLAHGFMVGYFLQPITVHDTEVLKNLIGQSKVTGHEAMCQGLHETAC